MIPKTNTHMDTHTHRDSHSADWFSSMFWWCWSSCCVFSLRSGSGSVSAGSVQTLLLVLSAETLPVKYTGLCLSVCLSTCPSVFTFFLIFSSSGRSLGTCLWLHQQVWTQVFTGPSEPGLVPDVCLLYLLHLFCSNLTQPVDQHITTIIQLWKLVKVNTHQHYWHNQII